MKIWKSILLALITIGLPVIGIMAILGYALCKSAARADRAIERMSPPKDYPE
jgi:hypothetical protein